MQESEFEADLVLAFAAQLRGNIEIERGPFRRQRLRAEFAPSPQSLGRSRFPYERKGSNAQRSGAGDHLDPEDRLRNLSRLTCPAPKAQPISACRKMQPGPAVVEQTARRIGMPDRYAVGLAGSDPGHRPTA